jgi:hypothetical protein
MLRKSRAVENERLGGMKGERWSRVNVRGINPYTIDRVVGTFTTEFSRTGRSLPIGEYSTVEVRAYDVRCPDGTTFRFARLKDAKTFIVYESNGLLIPAALAAGLKVG